MKELKIKYNPYACAFRDSMPSETTGEALKGGQICSPTKTVSPPQTLPSSNTDNNTTVESGNCLQILKFSPLFKLLPSCNYHIKLRFFNHVSFSFPQRICKFQ